MVGLLVKRVIVSVFAGLLVVGLFAGLLVVESANALDYDWMTGSDYSGYYNVTAASGSSWDIQLAVDDVEANGTVPYAGCGNVFVPVGNYTFNINFTNLDLGNGYAGVQVSGGVNIFGSGGADVGSDNTTILFCGLGSWNYSNMNAGGQKFFIVDGRNGKSSRIAGFYMQGSVNTTAGADDNRYCSAVKMMGVVNYRVDHCTFVDFCNVAVLVTNNYAHTVDGNKGVIDHCIFDNPYKDGFFASTGNYPQWAYGVSVEGDSPTWYDYTEFYGNYTHDTCFIEDCSFARCRHCVAGAAYYMGFYVLRHCNMTDMIQAGAGSYQDMHSGTIGSEVYDCNITNTEYDARSGEGEAGFSGIGLYSRGGAALYYNNSVNYFNGSGTAVGVYLINLDANEVYRVKGTFIWDNVFVDVTNEVVAENNTGCPDVRLNVDYFLRAPVVGDGFSYVPYVYPHPLVSDEEFVDSTAPVITVTSPVNTTYTTSSINLTVSSDEVLVWSGYVLNGVANVTFTGSTISLAPFTNGIYTIRVYGNDSSGNMGASALVYFTVVLQPTEEEVVSVVVDYMPFFGLLVFLLLGLFAMFSKVPMFMVVVGLMGFAVAAYVWSTYAGVGVLFSPYTELVLLLVCVFDFAMAGKMVRSG